MHAYKHNSGNSGNSGTSDRDRDRYHQGQPLYTYLETWQSLMLCGKIQEAIAYWRSQGLHPDMYVRKRPGCWVTVFQFCLSRAEYADMTKVIFKRASATLPPDADNYYLLPFVCHSLYLQALVAKITSAPDISEGHPMLYHSISHVLDSGDVTRLRQLMRLGYLKEGDLREYIASEDVILNKLGVMIKYLTYCYNVRRSPDLDLTRETVDTISKFGQTIEFLRSYGAVWTPESTRLCIDHYIYELLVPGVGVGVGTDYEPIYHTQMDSTQVAILRPLLNDYRYVETCRALGCTPDSDVYNYNIG